MSVDFVTRQPMNLEQAKKILLEAGCHIIEDHRGTCALDPQGNYFWLTDNPSNYISIAINLNDETAESRPIEIHDGTSRVMGTSYGTNNPVMMAVLLGMVCEFDAEFHTIMGAAIPKTTAEGIDRT